MHLYNANHSWKLLLRNWKEQATFLKIANPLPPFYVTPLNEHALTDYTDCLEDKRSLLNKILPFYNYSYR